MNIGVFGGSFDPIHIGHLIFAQQMCDAGHLDIILFVPAQNQYMKDSHVASFQNRCAMVQLAINSNPKFYLEVVETNGNSYTYDTLQVLKNLYPKDKLIFIAGTDILESLEKWYKIDELGSLCSFMIGTRAGIDKRASYLKSQTEFAYAQEISLRNHLDISFVSTAIEFEMSSTYIRRELSEGNRCRYLIPNNVANYISEHRLYGKEKI